MTLYEFDNRIKAEGFSLVCGVDEAGRGPLAGRVYAAAVILPEEPLIEGLNDSKKLTEKKREALYDEILEQALDFGVGWADEGEIDQINILQASFLAMRRAAEQLSVSPDIWLIDGNRHPHIAGICRCEVKGDGHSAAIAAASILAKVSRDRYMLSQDALYPDYEFAQHKGYGTALHYEKLAAYGPCPIHRRTFLKNIDRKAAPNKGIPGEDSAAGFLTEQGCILFERNARSAYGEIDIITQDGAFLAFVEVKQRNERSIDRPAAWVDKGKQQRIIQTAQDWMVAHESALQPRFDIIEVITGKEEQINWIKNAFSDDVK